MEDVEKYVMCLPNAMVDSVLPARILVTRKLRRVSCWKIIERTVGLVHRHEWDDLAIATHRSSLCVLNDFR